MVFFKNVTTSQHHVQSHHILGNCFERYCTECSEEIVYDCGCYNNGYDYCQGTGICINDNHTDYYCNCLKGNANFNLRYDFVVANRLCQ